MLAYVFWHCRKADVEQTAYEEALSAFHEVLAAHKPPGFIGSQVFRLPAVDWLGGSPEVYEDWYLVEGSAALDLLNEAAITAPRLLPHDTAAAHAAAGTAGLYRLRLGGKPLAGPTLAYWLAKPEGESYDAFFTRLDALASSGCVLWGRQMVLGPTPEFCLHATGEVTLPADLAAVQVRLEKVR